MKRRELFWMLIPCLILAGVALWMRTREARMPPTYDGPFLLFIEKIEKRPIRAKDAADGYDTEVVAILNYKGPKPDWWGKQSGNYGSSENKTHLWYEANDKSKAVKLPPDFKTEPQVFYWRPGWQSKKERYEARYLLKLSELPLRPEKTVLRGKIAIEDSAMSPAAKLSPDVPFSFTVRGPKQVVKAPVISRDPLLRIVKAEIKKPSAAEQKTNGGYDTLVQVQLLDLKPDDSGGGSRGGDEIVDEKGNRINGRVGWGSSSGVESSSAGRLTMRFSCRLAAIPRSQRHVFLKMKHSQGDRWPLIVKVPLRLNGKNSQGAVKGVPVQ